MPACLHAVATVAPPPFARHAGFRNASTILTSLALAPHSTGEASARGDVSVNGSGASVASCMNITVFRYQLVIGHDGPVKPGSVGKLLPGVGVAILMTSLIPSLPVSLASS